MTISPGRRILLAAVGEEEFLQHVISTAKRNGWWTYHTRDSRRSSAGWPDLVCIRPPRILFAELKTVDETLTPQQRSVGELLRACGLDWFCWRPTDEQQIDAVLA